MTFSFTNGIFTASNSRNENMVPLNNYQEFAIRRFRIDREYDTQTDTGRMKALMWYIETYGSLRRPLRIPLSAEQILWLLSPAASYMSRYALPRVVEAFWRKSMTHINPFESEEGFSDVSYWWACELTPLCGVEHVLISDSMINALSAPKNGVRHPLTAFLARFMQRRPDVGWAVNTAVDRLACYIRVLAEPLGVHYSIFFPSSVIEELKSFHSLAQDHPLLNLFASDIDLLKEKVRATAIYSARHRELRNGRQDISTALLEDYRLAPKVGITSPTDKPRKTAIMDHIGNGTSPLVRVIGPINSQSGLGQATRMSIVALQSAGFEPLLVNFDLDNPAPRSRYYDDIDVVTPDRVVNLIHLNAESIPLASAYLSPKYFLNSYNIGYFFWELAMPARCHELALELLDEIWVSSEFNVECYGSATLKPIRKPGLAVETLPEITMSREAIRNRYGLPKDAYIFIVTFDGFSFIKRKNPQAAIRAFVKAFGGDPEARVALVIKTHNLGAVLGESKSKALVDELRDLIAVDPRIVNIDTTLPYQELVTLKSACDAYVSLHRSEGWGFGILEAMQLGMPVITTAFSGNLEFCTPSTAFLVPYTIRYLEPDDYIFVRPGDYWAEPDESAASSIFKNLYVDPSEGRTRGEQGRNFVMEHFSPIIVGSRYATILKEIALSWRKSG